MEGEAPGGNARGRDAVEDLVGELGVAMLAAGYAVTDVGSTLAAVATAHGRPR